MKPSFWIVAGAISGFLGVALGAFAAHGLRERVSEKAIAWFQTGAQYQMYHALALILFGLWGLWATRANSSSGLMNQVPGWAFITGTLLFSGSLYAMALTDIRALGAITPFGGVSFLLGWIAFAILALRA